MDLHEDVGDLLAKYLPNTLIIPSYGNNDWLFHYQYPDGDHKSDFLSKMYKNWFLKQPKASKNPDLEKWSETFMEGGYYMVNFTDNFSILSLNTLMFNTNLLAINDKGFDANKQLDWLENHLNSSAPNHRFVLTYHIYPGS